MSELGFDNGAGDLRERRRRPDEIPATAAGFQELADDLCAEGRLDEAIEHYKRAIRLEGDDPSRHTRLGDAYLFAEDSAQALSHYRRALALNPGHGETHFCLAEMYRRFGKMKGAISLYRKAVTLVPDNAYYHYRLANAYAQAGRVEEAIRSVQEAIRLSPNDGFYHFWLGDFYLRLHRTTDAVRELEAAVICAPFDDYYCVRLGMLFTLAERGEDAVALFRRAIRLRPENASYHCLLADAFASMGFALRAAMHYEIAGELDPYDREYVARQRARIGVVADANGTNGDGEEAARRRSQLRDSFRCFRRRGP
jgi:tetratricopeptide (TPR) repeat protein